MGAAALASGNEACPSVDGLFDPGSGPLCGSDRDHGTDLRLLIERIAGVHLLDAFGEPLRQSLPARLVHKDALHGDAALPGVAEASGKNALRRELDICILMNDHGSVAAELKGAAH